MRKVITDARSRVLPLWFAGAAVTLSAVAGLAADPAGGSLVFSAADMHHMYDQLGEEQDRRAAPNSVLEVEGPVVELEPFVVQGDSSLVIAAVRRYLELGPESIRRRVAELAPTLSSQADLAGRINERFLTEPTGGTPADRGPGVFPLDNHQLGAIGRTVGKFVGSAFSGESDE